MKKWIQRAPCGFLFLLLIGPFLSCTGETSPQAPLSSARTFTSLAFEVGKNASGGLDKDYLARWDASEKAWIAGIAPSSFDPRSAIVTFTISPGATAKVGATPQISGVTPNDFSSPVTYTITAEDGEESSHKVSLTRAQAPIVVDGTKTRVRIASWNLNDCDLETGNKITYYDNIAAAIKKEGIDVIGLCEIQQDDEIGADISNLQNALRNVGWPMANQVSIEVGSEDDLAVLSRYPIVDKWSVAPGTRPIMRVDLMIGSTTIHYFVCHLKAMGDDSSLNKRVTQAKALADYVRAGLNPTQDIIVFGGDMNSVSAGDRLPTSTVAVPTLTYLQLRDDSLSSNDFLAMNEFYLPSAYTWYSDGSYPSAILDHLILSPAAQAAYVKGSVGVYLPPDTCSDHCPVLLDLDL